MSVAACGGGMGGSDDDNGGGEKKKEKGISKIPHSLPLLSDEDTDIDEDDEKETDNKRKRRSTLDCLASLEDSLPMKRGLSSNYYGKSKSFGNLAEFCVEDSKDLGKKEHAVNKRRRLLIAHEFREKSLLAGGCSSNITHASSMPEFFSDHRENEDENKDGKNNNEDKKKGNGDDKKNQEDGN